jgi:hypothetical protein
MFTLTLEFYFFNVMKENKTSKHLAHKQYVHSTFDVQGKCTSISYSRLNVFYRNQSCWVVKGT